MATAAHVSRITATHDVLGTLGYIAPERLDGEPGGPLADVYSLAAVAFEVLSGQRPQRGATPAEALRRSAAEPPPDLREAWPHAPAAAAAVLGRGLDPDPDRRQPSAGRLIEELEAALQPSGAATAAGPPGQAGDDHRLVQDAACGRRWSGHCSRSRRASWRCSWPAATTARRPAPGRPRTPARTAPARARVPRPSEGSTTTTTTTTTTAPAPAAPTAGRSGAELNDQGFALIQAGHYEEAVPVLRRAVDSFPEGTTRPQLRVRALQPRQRAPPGGPARRGDPDPRAAAPDPQPDREREARAGGGEGRGGGGKETKEPKQASTRSRLAARWRA